MKKLVAIFLASLLTIYVMHANPLENTLEKALETGEWTLVEETSTTTIWTKNDVTFEWCNKKDYHYVKLEDNENILVVDDWGSSDYTKIAHIKWCIIDKNKDPEVEWLEIKNNKLTGRTLKPVKE